LKIKEPIVYDKAKYYDEYVMEEFGLPQEQASVHTDFYLGWIIGNDLYSVIFQREFEQMFEDFKSTQNHRRPDM